MADRINDPGKNYRHPSQLLRDKRLSRKQKKQALRNWENEEKDLLRADEESMTAQDESAAPPAAALLKEIQCAERKLEGEPPCSSDGLSSQDNNQQEPAMSVKDDINKEASHAVEEIREDISALKSNVVDLARNLREIGVTGAHVTADYLREQVDGLKNNSTLVMEKTEERIKASPAQSVAVAFAAGVVASYLFNRR